MSGAVDEKDDMRKPLGRRAIALYAILAVTLSWCIQLPAILLLGLDNCLTKAVFVLVMWSPTVLALGSMARSRPAREGVRWRLGKLQYLPFGIGVETMIGFSMLTILMVAGAATSGWFTFGARGVSIAGGPWVFGTGFQHWPLLLLNVGATAITYSIIGLVATTGEEFAWRGFLQGHLEQHYSVVAAILWVALIWWAWHLPGLIAGYNFPETPLLGALLMFPLQMIGASLFFGWLTVRSGSFWPAALADASVNSIQQGVFDDLRLSGPAFHAHLVRTALIFAVGAICWWRLRSPGRSRAVP